MRVEGEVKGGRVESGSRVTVADEKVKGERIVRDLSVRRWKAGEGRMGEE